MSGITIKAARINAKLSQDEACKIIGVSKKTLSNWENGITFPKQPQIEKMCLAYQVKYDQLKFDISEQ